MDVCSNLTKFILSLINIILWGIAIVLIFVAGWISREYLLYRGHLSGLISTALFPVFVLLAAGVLLFIFVAVGCVALLKENKCLLGLFFVFLLVIVIALSCGLVVSLVLKEKLDSLVRNKLQDERDNYKSDLSKAQNFDFIQTEFQCCGVFNYSEWVNTDWYNTSNPDVKYPSSCCKSAICYYSQPDDPQLNRKGCYKVIKEVISTHFIVILSSAAGCLLILMVGLICSCILLCYNRRLNRPNYAGLVEEDEQA